MQIGAEKCLIKLDLKDRSSQDPHFSPWIKTKDNHPDKIIIQDILGEERERMMYLLWRVFLDSLLKSLPIAASNKELISINNNLTNRIGLVWEQDLPLSERVMDKFSES